MEQPSRNRHTFALRWPMLSVAVILLLYPIKQAGDDTIIKDDPVSEV